MSSENEASEEFKKPVFVSKVGRLTKKAETSSNVEQDSETTAEQNTPTKSETDQPPQICSSYKEPEWSGKPETNGEAYKLEVLKNGSIIETINLMDKPYHVIGRLNTNSICMQHPTVSRFHAVIQYRAEPSESDEAGFYVYDLGSTHGTFLNKMRLKPKVYARIRVGHVLKLGCSTRMLILTGPEEDAENESEFSVTELKQQRQEELQRRDEIIAEVEKQAERKRKKIEEAGIDWGMGEDAEDEPDLSENPFAQTNNEELYLDNPKTTLRGFFEREGLDLEYDCKEQGIGQFCCRVELPIDDEVGRPIFAEVIHKGKKKEAVIQCALEACRILDKHGVLRQSTHESRKRKPKNWEENDFYDSDDDTYLDRTGSIEKKREMRMKAKQPQKAETYECLLEKEKEISKTIQELEGKLNEAEEKLAAQEDESAADLDSLDSYMMNLKETKPDKQSVKKLRLDIANLQKEHKNIVKLVNIAKPTSLPALIVDDSKQTSNQTTQKKALPIFGKRRKIKVEMPLKPVEIPKAATDEGSEEEVEENEEIMMKEEEIETENLLASERLENVIALTVHERFLGKVKEFITNKSFKSIKMKLIEVDHKIDTAASDGVEMDSFKSQQEKLIDLFTEMEKKTDNYDLGQILRELDDLLNDIKEAKPKETVRRKVKADTKAVVSDKIINNSKSSKEAGGSSNKANSSSKKEKKKDKQVSGDYQPDGDYEMWVPPSGQTGDGRTSLNDKYGY